MQNFSKITTLTIFVFLILFTSCFKEPRERAIDKAISYLEVPYKFGGTNYEGIDCSALMQISFQEANITLPRRAVKQSNKGIKIKLSEVRKGDLLFFQDEEEDEISHVGLVIDGVGENVDFVHASGKDKKVLISNFFTSERKKTFKKARRFFR